MKTKQTLEVELKDGGSFKVLVNGLHLANLVQTPTTTEAGIMNMWHVMSLTASRKNGRGRYEQPEDAIKAYYGRKATVKQ
jgi:hypothetical protein